MSEIQLIRGDITKIKADIIVNAANTSLMGGGGVDGAIHRTGGKQILEDCYAIKNKQGGCKVGEAVHTRAGKLNAKYVIHTVGPNWNGGRSNEEKLLQSCYSNCLFIAEELKVSSITFPNISTGIYRFPKDRAASIAIKTIKNHPFQLQVTFVCFDEENYSIYKKILNL